MVFVRGFMVPFNGVVINRFFDVNEHVVNAYDEIDAQIGMIFRIMLRLTGLWELLLVGGGDGILQCLRKVR